MIRPLVFDLVERHWRLWPAVLGLFLALSYLVFPTAWSHVGPLTLRDFAHRDRRASCCSPVTSPTVDALAARLSYIGGSTLYIYVMHKIVIFYSNLAMTLTGTHFRGEEIVQLVVTVPLCAVVGRWIAAQPALAWLFTAPWVRRGRRAPSCSRCSRSSYSNATRRPPAAPVPIPCRSRLQRGSCARKAGHRPQRRDVPARPSPQDRLVDRSAPERV